MIFGDISVAVSTDEDTDISDDDDDSSMVQLLVYGVRLSPFMPPIVPRIPDIDLISVMYFLRNFGKNKISSLLYRIFQIISVYFFVKKKMTHSRKRC